MGQKVPHKQRAIAICMANLKGGVGKTTLTVTLADALSREGKKVLVVDLDGQANTRRTISLNQGPVTLSVAEVLLSSDPDLLAKAICKETKIENVHHLPARYKLHSHGFIEEIRTIAANPYKILRRRLDPIRDQYDFILIDTPPQISLVTLNGLAAADAYLIPFESGDIYAFDGMEDMEDSIERLVRDPDVNPNLEFLGAVLQAHQGKNNACKATEALIENRGYPIFASVPNSTQVKQAAMQNQTIMQYARNNAAACAYAEMAKKILAHYGLSAGIKPGRKASRSIATQED